MPPTDTVLGSAMNRLQKIGMWLLLIGIGLSVASVGTCVALWERAGRLGDVMGRVFLAGFVLMVVGLTIVVVAGRAVRRP